MTTLQIRTTNEAAYLTLCEAGLPPTLARLYAARGIASSGEIDHGLTALLIHDSLKNSGEMAIHLADAIADGKKLLVIADYDADGATACAVAIRGLRSLGAKVDYLVPNRFEYGYGLTPEIVRLAAQRQPDCLLTVDNGIASIEGVAEARRLGMQVLVTDHHLPGAELPKATCIVNPNQPGCPFPDKALAGVGVMFYVLLALRAELRRRGTFDARPEPNMADLLDLVALGTVADVVKLGQNNRILVHQGLRRIRAGRACPGIAALLMAAKRTPSRTTSLDLGFAVGPRLNAAGRLEDMALGIECLLSDDPATATEIATRLDALNRERRNIEADMQDSALTLLEGIEAEDGYTLTLFEPDWHQGVIGILASRLKERFHRTTIAFARGTNGEIKGSGRAIPGLHLRDALDLVSKRHPGLIRKFGGHAAAAGLTIAEADLDTFRQAFERVAREWQDVGSLARQIETDGPLPIAERTLETARLLEQQVWGQGFPAPQFDDIFNVIQQRIVGERHLKVQLEQDGSVLDGIFFNQPEPLPPRVRAVYSLEANEYNGRESVQVLLRHCEAA